jgi:GDP-4-dehydro-6-deoxy-D-mannose reductase
MQYNESNSRRLCALISGAEGFVGGYLIDVLLQRGWDVIGFDIKPSNKKIIRVIKGDLGDLSGLTYWIREVKPDVIFHLAGLLKAERADLFYQSHIFGTIALYEAILQANIRPLVVIASSSAVYGTGSENKPITERSKPRPGTHYGISKLAQELVGLRYFDVDGLPVTIMRMFNLLGPGQSPGLACSAFARQIAIAEMQGGGVLTVGNLSTYRDFVDVRDAVRACEMIASRGEPGKVYNVCSGHAVSIQFCLDLLLSMSSIHPKVIFNPEQIQNGDVSIQIGSASLLRRQTGWKPQIPLDQSFADLLNYWRDRVKTRPEQLNELE